MFKILKQLLQLFADVVLFPWWLLPHEWFQGLNEGAESKPRAVPYRYEWLELAFISVPLTGLLCIVALAMMAIGIMGPRELTTAGIWLYLAVGFCFLVRTLLWEADWSMAEITDVPIDD